MNAITELEERVDRVKGALRALADLIRPVSLEGERERIEARREDLGCLFEILGKELEVK